MGGGRRSGEGHLKISDIPSASSLNRTLPLQDRLMLNKLGGGLLRERDWGGPSAGEAPPRPVKRVTWMISPFYR